MAACSAKEVFAKQIVENSKSTTRVVKQTTMHSRKDGGQVPEDRVTETLTERLIERICQTVSNIDGQKEKRKQSQDCTIA